MSDEKKKQIKALGRGRTLAYGGIGKNNTPAAQVGFELLEPIGETKMVNWAGFLTPAAEKRTTESLQSMGWSGNDPDELEPLMEAGKLSKVVELVLEEEEWKEKRYWKVRFVNNVGGRVKKLDGSALADVKARLKQRIGNVAAPTPAPSQSDAPDDEIPF